MRPEDKISDDIKPKRNVSFDKFWNYFKNSFSKEDQAKFFEKQVSDDPNYMSKSFEKDLCNAAIIEGLKKIDLNMIKKKDNG